jgi:hypothetical protein
MLGIYDAVWKDLPFSWRAAIGVFGMAIVGHSISPLGTGAAIVFRADQHLACKDGLHADLLAPSRAMDVNLAYKKYVTCTNSIPKHPGVLDQIDARDAGRTILFEKR